jgi:hypothetical protein
MATMKGGLVPTVLGTFVVVLTLDLRSGTGASA